MDVLDGDMTKYTCCQNMFGGCCCCKPGQMGEADCPYLCLCLEVTCCLSFAISSSRWYLMEKRGLHSDPCDRRLIRVNNCIQIIACICQCLSICIPELRDLATIISWLADCVFLCTAACMCAQVRYELREPVGTKGDTAPQPQVMG